ncbi:hypothetical protein Pyn_12209 [Prunus yedoensis var. nudiflora]|uniref:Uncharacterized protein n=1 Tax=Prunus yedoensis var. nudiflora TaxID=2094558 RepID=A0A314ZL20_PRUYE|nr:hypothetical protein Pyn_12209 [Prunus yedoensis var. nudiflora]
MSDRPTLQRTELQAEIMPRTKFNLYFLKQSVVINGEEESGDMAGFCKEDDARWLQLEKRRRRRSLGLTRKTTLVGCNWRRGEDDARWLLGYLGSF